MGARGGQGRGGCSQTLPPCGAAQAARGPVQLGRVPPKGRGVPQDFGRAVELYRKAAAQGHGDAMCNLAHCLEKGQGVPVADPEGAFLWFQHAYDKRRSQSAAYHLGRCHFLGVGTVRDEAKAAAILGERVWELGKSREAQHEDDYCRNRACNFG